MPFFKNTEEILKAFEEAMSMPPAAATQVNDVISRLLARTRASTTQVGETSAFNTASTIQS